MFEATLTRLVISLPEALGALTAKEPKRHGPLPTWIEDPQLSKKLLNDTGLTQEDLVGSASYDERKPFFMQQNYW